MAVLVIADHDGSTVRDTTHKTVTAALGPGSGTTFRPAARTGRARPGHAQVKTS